MSIPLNIEFHYLEESAALEHLVREQFAATAGYYDDILRGSVVIDIAQQRQRADRH